MPLTSGFGNGDLLSYAIWLRRRPALGYPLLIGAIAAATLTRWILDGQVLAGPFITYHPVIIIAALLGGFWTGVVSIVCSAALGWYIFLEAAPPLASENASAASLLTFITIALLDVAIVAVVNKAVIRLAEQEKNVRSLVEALPSGVVVINGQGLIANTNAAAERIFGYRRSELIGAPIDTLVPDRFRDKHAHWLAAYLRNPQPLGLGPHRQFKGKRKDGSEISVEVGLTPIERYSEVAVVATVIDISERVRAQEHERLLTRELQHRTQNLFSVIQAIVVRTMVGEHSLEDAKQQLAGRLNALAGAHSAIIGASWEGASLIDILKRELGQIAPNAMTISGCELAVNASAAQQFALIFHELTTNAFKYGALSAAGGRVTVAGLTSETAEAQEFTLVWTEQGGPQVVEPTRKGFGSSILFEAAKQFGMAIQASYRPEGFVYSLTVALQDIRPRAPQLVPPAAPVSQHSTIWS